MPDLVTVDHRDGIAVLTFQREKSLNAMTTGLARAICETLAGLDARADVEGIVLTGAGGRAFCAGVDLDEGRRQEPATIEAWFGTICAVYRAILDKLIRRGWRRLDEPVSVSKAAKLWIALRYGPL